jgi:hypothetical protein
MAEMSAAAQGRKLLEQSPLFAAMVEQRRRELVAQARPRSVSAGESICRLGDLGVFRCRP